MAVQNWREFLVTLVLGKTEKPWWGRFLTTVGAISDMLSEGMVEALRMGWLHREQLPRDALKIVGDDSNLDQYPAESNEQFQARVLRRWDDWPFAGHDTSVIGQLEAAGFTGATIVTHDDRLGPKGEPAPYWSQFWVGIPAATLAARPGWTTTPRWGSIVWGCFWWGTGAMSVSDAQLFWGIVRKWKPNDWVCRGVELL